MNKDKAKLLADHKRLIESEAAKYAQFVPLTLALSEAYKLADQAADNFDTHAGIKFSTYLVNTLKKLSRLSTQYGAMGRLPESQQFKLHKVVLAEKALVERLGRHPSAQEIADECGINVQNVNDLLHQKKQDINISNLAHTPVIYDDNSDEWVHFVYHDLTDIDKLLFEYKTGYGGKQVIDNAAIAKKLHIPESAVTHRLKMITDKIKEGMK